MGIVYFLQRANGDIKIGTTINYTLRLADLTRDFGPLTLLGVMLGSYDEERAVHERFAQYRLGRSEFFMPSEEILTYVRNNTNFDIPEDQGVSTQIAIKPTTYEALKEFRNGLDGDFSDTLRFLVHLMKDDEDDTYAAGKKLRLQFKEFKKSLKPQADVKNAKNKSDVF